MMTLEAPPTLSKPQLSWKPDHYESYFAQPGKPTEAEIAEARESFQKLLEEYWSHVLEDGVRSGITRRFGAEIGKAYIRCCELGQKSDPENFSQTLLQLVDQVYRVFGEQYKPLAKRFIGGFLGEYVVAHTLVNQGLYDVYFPAEGPVYEEGEGVDWWVDLRDGTDEREDLLPDGESIAVAVQIKCLPFKPGIRRRRGVFLRDEEDVEALMTNEFTPYNFDSEEYEHKLLKESFLRLLHYCESHKNAMAYVLLYDAPDAESEDISRRNGTLRKENIISMLDDMAALKEYYLSIKKGLT